MNFLICFITLLSLQMQSCIGDDNCPGNGWENAVNSSTHCYTLSDEEYTFDKAQNYCVSIGGNLVSIHSKRENGRVNIALLMNQAVYAYIGMRKFKSGSWAWLDGTNVDYDHWVDAAHDFSYAVMAGFTGYWYPSDGLDLHNAVCKKQLVEIPTTTVASSTTSSVVNGGCGRYTREGCLERNDSFVIDELFLADPIGCHHLCSGVFSDNCQSFQFDWDTGRCHLYSTPLVDVEDCQDIGGPDDPSLQECKDIGCQDFFKSSCDRDNLMTLELFEHLGDLESCQSLCREKWECGGWTVLDRTSCKLFYNEPTCRTLNGPGDTDIEKCL